jgi:hypothetical protein
MRAKALLVSSVTGRQPQPHQSKGRTCDRCKQTQYLHLHAAKEDSITANKIRGVGSDRPCVSQCQLPLVTAVVPHLEPVSSCATTRVSPTACTADLRSWYKCCSSST